MNALINDHTTPLSHAVERLVAEHGFRAVTAALMLRLVRRHPTADGPIVGHLTDHIRRDIGLPPAALECPVPPVIPLWPMR
jgi:hypothetical protein